MARQVSKDKLHFQASARVQRLLGRDLLPDDFSAVEELVKNAYDSNASRAFITIAASTDEGAAYIEIRDDGVGLSLDEFRRVWMLAGYSEKTGRPLPVSGRVQVGEKGIGRFSADKLGQHLVVITKRRRDARALRVSFDWSKFEDKRKLLSAIRIPYEFVGESTLSRSSSGTILRITGLRSTWNDKKILELRRRLALLLDPYQADTGFQIIVNGPKPRLSGPTTPSLIEDADFEWEVIRDEAGRVTVRRRRRIDTGPSRPWTAWETLKDHEPNGSGYNFGPARARFSYFAERPKKAQIGDAMPGVAVYRDGLRVEPAGSSSADWLGLLEKRAKRAGHMPLVPSRLFGYVEIDRESNPELLDATNRRAFLTGPAYDAFTTFLKSHLRELEAEVEREVAVPNWERSRRAKTQRLIQARNQTLSVFALGLAHELRQPLQSIRAASENIAGHLRHHDIRVPEIDTAVEIITRGIRRIDKHIRFINDISSGRNEAEEFDITSLLAELRDIFGDRLAAYNIALPLRLSGPTTITFNKPLLLTALTNLVLNALDAIRALDDQKPHCIDFQMVTRDDGGILIKVIDDGPGVPEDVRRRLFKRQTTGKQGGMGVALAVYKEMLQEVGADLTCESYANPTIFAISLPSEVRNGPNSDR